MKEELYKIGDFVRIKPENNDCRWFTDEIFQILSYNHHHHIYTISINLDSVSKIKNTIFIGNVYQDIECLKALRKKKLQKIIETQSEIQTSD